MKKLIENFGEKNSFFFEMQQEEGFIVLNEIVSESNLGIHLLKIKFWWKNNEKLLGNHGIRSDVCTMKELSYVLRQ